MRSTVLGLLVALGAGPVLAGTEIVQLEGAPNETYQLCDDIEMGRALQHALAADEDTYKAEMQVLERVWLTSGRRMCRSFKGGQRVRVVLRLTYSPLVCVESADKMNIRWDERHCFWTGKDNLKLVAPSLTDDTSPVDVSRAKLD